MAPPLLAALAHHPAVARFDLSALRLVGSGGAPASAALEQAVADRLGCLVGQGYGMTEAAPLIAVAPAQPSRSGCAAVPSGLLVPGTEATVVDTATGAPLPRGADGEVWVRGPQLMLGYRDDPEATAATIDADGWLHTGDLGHVDEDGHVFLVDRLKELIKVRGFQVAPAELEAVLVTPPGGRRRRGHRRARRSGRRAPEGVSWRARRSTARSCAPTSRSGSRPTSGWPRSRRSTSCRGR